MRSTLLLTIFEVSNLARAIVAESIVAGSIVAESIVVMSIFAMSIGTWFYY